VTTYQVIAKRWARGWELHIDGVGVTQSRTLGEAEGMVRDYVAATLDVPEDSFNVTITPQVGAGLDSAAEAVRQATRAAAEAARQAAEQTRTVARQLKDRGLSGRDIAAILKVSPQRVSQLLNRSKAG